MQENIEILNLSQQKEEGNYLVSEPNHHTTKSFYRKFAGNRNEKN